MRCNSARAVIPEPRVHLKRHKHISSSSSSSSSSQGGRVRSRAVPTADSPAAGPRRALDILIGERVPPRAGVARGPGAEADHHPLKPCPDQVRLSPPRRQRRSVGAGQDHFLPGTAGRRGVQQLRRGRVGRGRRGTGKRDGGSRPRQRREEFRECFFRLCGGRRSRRPACRGDLSSCQPAAALERNTGSRRGTKAEAMELTRGRAPQTQTLRPSVHEGSSARARGREGRSGARRVHETIVEPRACTGGQG